MKKLIFASALILSGPAYAQSPDYLGATEQNETKSYIGIGYTSLRDEYILLMDIDSSFEEGDMVDVEADGPEIVIGYKVNPNFSVEISRGFLDFRFTSPTDSTPTVDFNTTIISILFGIPAEQIKPYLRVAHVDINIVDETASFFTDDTMFGLGVEFESQDLSFRIEYQQYDDIGWDGFSVSAIHHF